MQLVTFSMSFVLCVLIPAMIFISEIRAQYTLLSFAVLFVILCASFGFAFPKIIDRNTPEEDIVFEHPSSKTDGNATKQAKSEVSGVASQLKSACMQCGFIPTIKIINICSCNRGDYAALK
jgi:hypothetical protein